MAKRLTVLIALGALGVGAALALPSSALACSCVGPAQGEEREFYRESLRHADGAFVGRLMKIRRIPDESQNGVSGTGRAVFVYRIRRAYKREGRLTSGRRIRIHTSGDGASCGLEGRRGRVAALFIYRHKGKWTSGLCSSLASPKQMRQAAAYKGRGSSDGGPCPDAA